MSTPIAKFTLGPVTAAVWMNENQGGNPSFSTTLTKRFKNKEGEWEDSKSLFVSDIANAVVCLQKALDYCILRTSGGGRPKEGTVKPQETEEGMPF